MNLDFDSVCVVELLYVNIAFNPCMLFTCSETVNV